MDRVKWESIEWPVIFNAANGHAKSLNRIARGIVVDGGEALAALALMDDHPHPAAVMVAVADTRWLTGAPLINAALAPHVATALAVWRADPEWLSRALSYDALVRVASGVARMLGDLRAYPDALHAAVDVALHYRAGNASFKDFGEDDWQALTDEQRAAIIVSSFPEPLGEIWGYLDDSQRTIAVEGGARTPPFAARLIIRIDPAAWKETDQNLRRTLIERVASDRPSITDTAPAWAGLTTDDHETLVNAVMQYEDRDAILFRLLDKMGSAGRKALTADLRAKIETIAQNRDAQVILAWRGVDAGWDKASDEERQAVIAAVERLPWIGPSLLRAIGIAGWNAMTADEKARIAAAVRRDSRTFFHCPPALWGALAGDALPPAKDIWPDARRYWRAEDAAADLSLLSPAHQATVLACAEWLPEDVAATTDRLTRFLDAWNKMTEDERRALMTIDSTAPITVAAAARLTGDSAAMDAVGQVISQSITAGGGHAAKRLVGDMLHSPDDWRRWMRAFAPTDGDSPDVWAAWNDAAERGCVPDADLCARLAERRAAARRCAQRR